MVFTQRGCLISPYSSEFRKNKEAEMLLNQRFCLLLFIQFRCNYTFWDSPFVFRISVLQVCEK